MHATADYLKQLQEDRKNLVDKLKEKGVEVSENETFTTLVPKLDSVKTGDDLSEYFLSEITENTSQTNKPVIIKKTLDIVVSDDVTSLSYLFKGYAGSKQTPHIVCNSNVTDFSFMYYGCNTEVIDVTGLDFFGVTTGNGFNAMFTNINKEAKIVGFENYTGENLKDISNLFENFGGKVIDLSKFNPTNVTNYSTYPFCYCASLEELDIDSWDLGNANFSEAFMFHRCGADASSPTKVYVKDKAAQSWVLKRSFVPSTWSTDNVIIAGSEQDERNKNS